MVFDKYDYEVLRLCGFCRYLPIGLVRRFNSQCFKAVVMYTLMNNGYIKMQSDESSYKLTSVGRGILADMGYEYSQDKRMDISRKTYSRKLNNALWNVLLHLAGIDIFAEKTSELAGTNVGYVSSLMLRSDNNVRVLAGTRFLGILKAHDTVYIPYFIEGEDDWLVPKHELEIYRSQVSVLKTVKDIKVIITGSHLEELWRYLHPLDKSTIEGRGMKRIDEALEELASDYMLIPTNDSGVMQMRVMSIRGYRERIAKAIGCSTERVYNLSDCDGFKENIPYIIAVDFNVNRIMRALRQIRIYNENVRPIICCLPFQQKTILRMLREYKAQNCLVLALDENKLFNNIFKEYIIETIEQTPYITEGGAYINANPRKIKKSDIKKHKD